MRTGIASRHDHASVIAAEQPRLAGRRSNCARCCARYGMAAGRDRSAQDRELAFKQATDRQAHARDGGAQAAEVRRQSRGASAPSRRACSRRRIDADLAALAAELEQRSSPTSRHAARTSSQPKREPLPAHLPRREIRHEPENTTCGCGCALKRIGEDVAEKLDYRPACSRVERHVRGKWVCALLRDAGAGAGAAARHRQGHPDRRAAGAGAGGQVPRPPAAVPAGETSSSAPAWRSRARRWRSGSASAACSCSRWSMRCGRDCSAHDVLHADETPVAMLKPGNGKTHRAYIWSYCTTSFNAVKAVVYDFADSRGGAARARASSGCPAASSTAAGRASSSCDDFSGYKACFEPA